jgi:hypothetical protein
MIQIDELKNISAVDSTLINVIGRRGGNFKDFSVDLKYGQDAPLPMASAPTRRQNTPQEVY